jgi:uncharacterized protein (TIGR02421 family)
MHSSMAEDQINAAFDAVIAAVRDRLSRNLRIRRTLPGEGRLRLDRQLPFLCVYRSPPGDFDEAGPKLVTTEAAYLFASGEPRYADGIARLCGAIRETLREHFGTLLLIEIWSEEAVGDRRSMHHSPPYFSIRTSACEPLRKTLHALESALREVQLQGASAEVNSSCGVEPHPPRLQPVAPSCLGENCFWIGLGVRPVYRHAESGAVFPIVLESLRRQLAAAIRKAVFAFTGHVDTTLSKALAHYESLGPSAMSKAARNSDQRLCEVSQSFDFLLQATPVNSEAAWQEFSKSAYRSLPTLYYRPLPYHPALLKRQLYSIPLEHVEDATLAHLFDEKQDELGRQLSALKTIGTPAFFYDSLQIYGKPDDALVQLADDVLARTPDVESDDVPTAKTSLEIAEAAREHIDYYHRRLASFNAKVQLVDSIASTLMVAKDQLLISRSATLRKDRVQPLLQHEVGAHLLTYFNGQQQPLRLLYAGFAGYEALQEGLAVLAEYLVGGLSLLRTRTLAARVAAVHALAEGAPFAETFDLLHRQRGVGPKTAFMTTLRAYRGGGLTKDFLYLRGLHDLLKYLRQGHDLEPLYAGKISLERLDAVRELRRRGLVHPPALLPRCWHDADHAARLEMCRRSSLLELLEPSS